MNTNNQRGRAIALTIGIYLIAKSILNKMLGGDSGDIMYATVETIFLFTGLQYVNYVIAVITGFVFLYYLKGNLADISSNWIYLAEGIIDVICAVLLIIHKDVKEHFTNKWIKK